MHGGNHLLSIYTQHHKTSHLIFFSYIKSDIVGRELEFGWHPSNYRLMVHESTLSITSHSILG